MPATEEGIIEKINQVNDMAYDVAVKCNLTSLLPFACKEEIDVELENSVLRLLINIDLSDVRTYQEMSLLALAGTRPDEKVRQIMSLGDEASSESEAHSFREVVYDLVHFLDMKTATLEATLTKSTNIQGA